MKLDRGFPRSAGRLFLGLAVGAVVFYLAEVGLRIAGLGPAYQAGATGSWRMNAGLKAEPLKGPRDVDSFRVTTNADGLRTTLPKARTAGRIRVAVMGDSTVFGWGVNDGGSVAEGLQSGLDALRPGAAEVLNAGQPGYSTTQAAWLFSEVVADYRPDVVVVFVPMHDFNRVLVSDRELLEGGQTLAARARIALASRSRVYQLLRQSIWPLTEQPALTPEQRSSEPRVERVSDAERTRALDDMRTRLAEWNGKALVGFLPFLAELEGVAQSRPGLEWGRAWSEAAGVPVVDVRSCCKGRALTLPNDPGHLTAEGNAQVGAAAAPLLAPVLRW